jgi:hypothetical protein
MKLFAKAKKELQAEGNHKPKFAEILKRMNTMKTANSPKKDWRRKPSRRSMLYAPLEKAEKANTPSSGSGSSTTPKVADLGSALATIGDKAKGTTDQVRQSPLLAALTKSPLLGGMALGGGGALLGRNLGHGLSESMEQVPDASTSAAHQMYLQRKEGRRRKRYGLAGALGGGGAGLMLLSHLANKAKTQSSPSAPVLKKDASLLYCPLKLASGPNVPGVPDVQNIPGQAAASGGITADLVRRLIRAGLLGAGGAAAGGLGGYFLPGGGRFDRYGRPKRKSRAGLGALVGGGFGSGVGLLANTR